MKFRHHLKFSKKLAQSVRTFGNDPTKSFYNKGFSEKSRKILREHQKEVRELREYMQQLAKYQLKLENEVEQTYKALLKILERKGGDNGDQPKKKI